MIEINRENVLAFLTEEEIEWFRVCMHFDAWYKPNPKGEVWGESLDYDRYNQLSALMDEIWRDDLVHRFSTGSDGVYRLTELGLTEKEKFDAVD